MKKIPRVAPPMLLFFLAAVHSPADDLPPAERGPTKVILGEDDFRDRVYACWIGKTIGGTLGMPAEGRREFHDFSFYDPVPSQPAPNDDLDLALLWVEAVKEHGLAVDAPILGESWLKYVCVDWNEYGVGRANLRDGFPPPISGHFRNERWRGSNGAWIRSETWACLFPGCPSTAVRYAYEDACVDHGAAEGTLAELFTAAVQSAAFVERDRNRLLEIGLAYLPPRCEVAKSVRVAVESHRRGLDLKGAREAVVEASKATGWFMAPQNVAFVVLGILYGEGDFGKSICATVNCGDDTDSTGATVGALMGILLGTKGIPAAWRSPVGEGIRNVAISGFKSPRDLKEFTDQTVLVAKRVLKESQAPVEVRAAATTDLSRAPELRLVDPEIAGALWARSPWKVTYDLPGLRMMVDYIREPRIEAGVARPLRLEFHNLTAEAQRVGVVLTAPKGLAVDPAVATVLVSAGPGATADCDYTLKADEVRERLLRGSLVISRGGQSPREIPLAFLARLSVAKDDLALSRLGAAATSDSELDREPGSTSKAIDGVIADGADFEGNRWHSALTPHPHWIEVHLPEPSSVGRVVIHFADPAGHPVDFDGEVSLDGKSWTSVFQERGYGDRSHYERILKPAQRVRHLRLTIIRSANPQYPYAAQLSEIELVESR